MKKAKVRTMYMIPMRLWSVVVTHEVNPRGCGRTASAVIIGIGLVVVSGATVAAMDQGVVFSSALRCACARTSAALIAAFWCCSHASNCVGVNATTLADMLAWLRPQSSAHWPVNAWPASLPGILNQVWFV